VLAAAARRPSRVEARLVRVPNDDARAALACSANSQLCSPAARFRHREWENEPSRPRCCRRMRRTRRGLAASARLVNSLTSCAISARIVNFLFDLLMSSTDSALHEARLGEHGALRRLACVRKSRCDRTAIAPIAPTVFVAKRVAAYTARTTYHVAVDASGITGERRDRESERPSRLPCVRLGEVRCQSGRAALRSPRRRFLCGPMARAPMSRGPHQPLDASTRSSYAWHRPPDSPSRSLHQVLTSASSQLWSGSRSVASGAGREPDHRRPECLARLHRLRRVWII